MENTSTDQRLTLMILISLCGIMARILTFLTGQAKTALTDLMINKSDLITESEGSGSDAACPLDQGKEVSNSIAHGGSRSWPIADSTIMSSAVKSGIVDQSVVALARTTQNNVPIPNTENCLATENCKLVLIRSQSVGQLGFVPNLDGYRVRWSLRVTLRRWISYSLIKKKTNKLMIIFIKNKKQELEGYFLRTDLNHSVAA